MVVLATPPFWFATARIRATLWTLRPLPRRFGGGRDSGLDPCGGGTTWACRIAGRCPPSTSRAGLARTLVAEALAGHAVIDDAVLVASELVANAVEHGTGPIELEIAVDEESVRITVTNGGAAGEPAVRAARDDEAGGRGLAITGRWPPAGAGTGSADRMSVWAEFTDR